MRGVARYPYRQTRPRVVNPDSEQALQKQVCQYLKLQYPHIIFRTDFAAGLGLTMRQAATHKSMQSGRAYPDLFIAYPSRGYHGLFIELKKDGVTIYKKDGELVASEHVREQAAVLEDLNRLGYLARFAVGFDQAMQLIDKYLDIKKTLPVDDSAF